MKKGNYSSIETIINIAKKGGMFILVDDEKRENEGDLVMSTSDTNARNINFMAKHGRGLICLALDSTQAKRLNLSLMSPVNQSRNQTAFTVSIEAKKGITTGISAKDRAKTIKIASKKNVSKKDIVSPGHVFPIIAQDGGVLVRAGHTEASVDISKLSNLNASSVICEVMNEDGRMARLDDLIRFSKKHNIKIASIADLIAYRLKNEKLIFRSKPMSDDAMPSGNGIACFSLQRLGFLVGDEKYLRATKKTLESGFNLLKESPHGHLNLLNALEEYLDPPESIIIVGEKNRISEWTKSTNKIFSPKRMVFSIPNNEKGLPESLAIKRSNEGKPTAYICKGHSCSEPIEKFEDLIKKITEST